MSKTDFWSVKNSVGEQAEILVYGPIASERGWFDNGETVVPQNFIDDLEALNGADVTVRINSGGGDVFAAHAIHNLLLSYKGTVNVVVDGLCASAATIIAMAGKTITMPSNALMMIHNPSIGLSDYYNAKELEDLLPALNAIKDSIIGAYSKRCKCSVEELSAMMDAETWLTAEECVKLGLADKVDGSIGSVIDGNKLVINNVPFDTKNYKNIDALVARVGKEEAKMNMNKNVLDKILNALGINIDEEPTPANVQNTAPADNVPEPIDLEAVKADAVAAERARIEALDALNDGNKAVLAVVDTAKKSGKNAEDIAVYVDAIKAVAAEEKKPAVENFEQMLADNKASGVDDIKPVPQNNNDEVRADQAASVDALVNAMKKINGGK